jgi:hypothetical protein
MSFNRGARPGAEVAVGAAHDDVLDETTISVKRPFSQSRNIIFMSSFCAPNLVLATVEI